MMKRTTQPLFLFSFLISLLFLGICSKSSPLYPMNDWVDMNCFFTVGRSMLDGLIPYRDIYEQKGPILYFLFAIASAISRHSFLGVFLLEVTTFALFLYFSGKCAQLYLGESPSIYVILTLLAPSVTLCEAFVHGGSAEQLCLWIFTFSLYLINRAAHEKRLLRCKEALVIGLCSGCVLYIKFTFLGFFLGLALFVLIWYLLYEKAPKQLPAIIGSFLGGILIVTVLVFLYFLLNGALNDFLNAFFKNNLTLYSGDNEGYPNRVYFYCAFMWITLYTNPEFTIPAVLGGLWLLLTPKKNHVFFTAFLLSFGVLSVATLGGGRIYPYYVLTFSAFTVYGFIFLALIGRKVITAISSKHEPVQKPLSPIAKTAGFCVLLVALLFGSYHLSSNTYLMAYEKEDMPQYQFAAYMNQKEDPTLLYYYHLDGGFYYAADITPTCKYFCGLNIPYEEMRQVQAQQVESGATDFVISRNAPLEEFSLDTSHYALVMTSDMVLEGQNFTYYLYEKK